MIQVIASDLGMGFVDIPARPQRFFPVRAGNLDLLSVCDSEQFPVFGGDESEKPHGIAASKQPAAHIFKAQGIDDLIKLVAKIIGTEALDVILP